MIIENENIQSMDHIAIAAPTWVCDQGMVVSVSMSKRVDLMDLLEGHLFMKPSETCIAYTHFCTRE